MAVQFRRLMWTAYRTSENKKTVSFVSVLQAAYHGISVPQNQESITVLSSGRGKRHVCRQGCYHNDSQRLLVCKTTNVMCITLRQLWWLIPRRNRKSPFGQAAGWCIAAPAAMPIASASGVQSVTARHKTGGKKSRHGVGSSSDEDLEMEELDEDDYEAPPQFRKMQIYVKSLRADSVVSSALDISRNRVDELFYGSRLRLNGEKLLKKSKQMMEGDYADLIVERSSDDDKILVKRVKVMEVSPDRTSKDKTVVTVKVWKTPFPVQDSSKGEWTQNS